MWDAEAYLYWVYGARLTVPAGRGLIMVISSIGGLRYLFNVVHSVGKATDCAQEVQHHWIVYVSLWLRLVKTAVLMEHVNLWLKDCFPDGETPELSGKCVMALATDPDILHLSGRVLPSFHLAQIWL